MQSILPGCRPSDQSLTAILVSDESKQAPSALKTKHRQTHFQSPSNHHPFKHSSLTSQHTICSSRSAAMKQQQRQLELLWLSVAPTDSGALLAASRQPPFLRVFAACQQTKLLLLPPPPPFRHLAAFSLPITSRQPVAATVQGCRQRQCGRLLCSPADQHQHVDSVTLW